MFCTSYLFDTSFLQLLISGSVDSLDVDDLRLNTNYVGGYHKVCSFFVVCDNLSLQ